MQKILLITLIAAWLSPCSAQVMPANTGYAVPAETDEESMFTKNGLEHWTDSKQSIQYHFYLRNKGLLKIAIEMKSAVAGNKIKVFINGKSFIITVLKSDQFKVINAGETDILKPGFYTIIIEATHTSGKSIADIKSIRFSGDASRNMEYNSKPRRNAASVHLRYPIPDSSKVLQFYNEVTVPAGADPMYTYYMACGFARGYFGMQVNSASERRIIFSVWDAGSETTDRSRVSDNNKVKLLAKGENVFADGFGNEGTGGHSHWIYPWKTDTTYKFLVTALPDSASSTTIYSGYFFIPESQRWKLIASFKAPGDGHYLNNLYSFSENFSGVNGQLQRKVYFGNQWIQSYGKWKELTDAILTSDLTGKEHDRIDFGGGAEGKRFYLRNGGFSDTMQLSSFSRQASNKAPVIDLNKNADSVAQWVTDHQLMNDAISTGRYDTTGSVNGIYYKILKEGSGAKISVTDTVVANYKGYLLNGEIFDQSKGTPVTFPLNRLIKGWQTGLPLCRAGGTIRLIIPSAQAYSIKARSGKIPPNSVLVFDIEVISRKPGKSL